jgi:hypothetical protein
MNLQADLAIQMREDQLLIRYTGQNTSFQYSGGDDVHRWLYKCNQYFGIEDIEDFEKLKLASYYLDGIALY